jgi:arylsulfatase
MNRREFMQMAGSSLAMATLPGCIHGAGGAQASGKRPNILIIFADDMGYSDIGCYGSEIRTPNLNRLASEGMRFTQFYNVARCCPSRASLLTGLYPHQAGVGKMVSQPGTDPEPGPYQGYLNDQCVTIAEVLRGAGYRTYMSGKWHVGERPEHWPRQRGFDRYFGLISGASSYWSLDEGRAMAKDDTPFTPEGDDFYSTDAFSDFAVECLEDHEERDEPFFMYLSYTAPHWPLHAWPEDIQRYRGKFGMGWDELRRERYARQLEMGLIAPQWALSPRDPEVPAWVDVDDKERWSLLMSVYAAMVDRMDQGIGRVLDALERTGADENTLVFFLADNGGCHENLAGRQEQNLPGSMPGEPGSYVAYDRPWANASNTPFRMFKHWIHEGGISTPLIARWPGQISAGGMTHEPGIIMDLMATCCDVTQTSYPEAFESRAVRPLVGKSLSPILRGGTREPHEWLYWEHFGNKGVRHGDRKLVALKSGEWELYDMKADRTELHDLSKTESDSAQTLDNAWNAWATENGVTT